MDKRLLLAEGRRFEFLDGLRGIAALLVTCLHFHTLIVERTPADFPLVFEHLFKNGNFGVQIFFVLSGFVIAYSIRNEIITSSFIMRFFLRRSMRLDPPYWITLIILTGLIVLGSLISSHGSTYVPSLKEFTLNAFYLPGFFGVDYILPVAWTLCLEFQFYIFFVLLVKA
ncbi:MAG TPA: acyltransferase, partial [Parachlamydiaceae bacterium]|nr:acyltransferase [Parachlamydiaceae bacterium]